MDKTKYSFIIFGLFVVSLILAFLQAGCGLFASMSTPTRYEQEVPAEYNLAGLQGQKILVLVEQPYWLNAKVNMRSYLTKAINKHLVNNAKVRSECLIPYEELADFRSGKSDYSLLSPKQVGAALNADMVLLVSINDCQLEKLSETDYYKASLSAQAYLASTAEGEKLWPDSAESRSIRVGFEIENKGLQAAILRLANASAHCIVRYFYGCKLAGFRIKEDKSAPAWEYWK